MPHEYDASTGAHVHRDETGLVRGVLHAEQLYPSRARTAQLAAQDYLMGIKGLLALKDSELNSLAMPTETAPTSDGAEYRLWAEKTQFDTTTVTFSQTYFGLPVWEAGLAVQIKANPFRIISAQSTAHADLSVKRPSDEALGHLRGLDERGLAHSLGVSDDDAHFHRKSLKIERRRLFVYRYEASQRVRIIEGIDEPPTHLHGPDSHRHDHSYPPLPPVPEVIRDHHHYVVDAVYFILGVDGIPNLRWVALIEAETLAVLMLRAFVAGVDGLVFRQDPITTAGGPLPNAPDALLNPLRSAVLLPKLDPPAGGNYALAGDNVQIINVEPPPIAPPIEPVATDFNFNARSDNFGAVNAYFHADGFFRLMADLGFDLAVFFGGTLFPTQVDHRGLGGAVVNAHCLGNGAFGILETAFGLADLTNVAQPLGIACDQRVVLHELAGHGTLYNHVNGPNFGFAHSAGDSVGRGVE